MNYYTSQGRKTDPRFSGFTTGKFWTQEWRHAPAYNFRDKWNSDHVLQAACMALPQRMSSCLNLIQMQPAVSAAPRYFCAESAILTLKM